MVLFSGICKMIFAYLPVRFTCRGGEGMPTGRIIRFLKSDSLIVS